MMMTQNGLPAGSWNGLDCGDMNNDGSDDLVMGAGSSGVHCYLYDSKTMSGRSITGLPASGAYYPQFGDINGDGILTSLPMSVQQDMRFSVMEQVPGLLMQRFRCRQMVRFPHLSSMVISTMMAVRISSSKQRKETGYLLK